MPSAPRPAALSGDSLTPPCCCCLPPSLRLLPCAPACLRSSLPTCEAQQSCTQDRRFGALCVASFICMFTLMCDVCVCVRCVSPRGAGVGVCDDVAAPQHPPLHPERACSTCDAQSTHTLSPLPRSYSAVPTNVWLLGWCRVVVVPADPTLPHGGGGDYLLAFMRVRACLLKKSVVFPSDSIDSQRFKQTLLLQSTSHVPAGRQARLGTQRCLEAMMLRWHRVLFYPRVYMKETWITHLLLHTRHQLRHQSIKLNTTTGC